MKAVLALDIATTTGYALRRADGRVESGAIDFGVRKTERSGLRWLKMRRWLQDFNATQSFDEVHFEDCVILSGAGQTQTARVYGGFVAIVEAFCESHQIPYHPIRIGTWKKHFTGNGAAKKDQIIAVCRQIGYRPVDSNEADALGILHVATGNCPLLTNSPAPKKTTRLKTAGELPLQPF